METVMDERSFHVLSNNKKVQLTLSKINSVWEKCEVNFMKLVIVSAVVVFFPCHTSNNLLLLLTKFHLLCCLIYTMALLMECGGIVPFINQSTQARVMCKWYLLLVLGKSMMHLFFSIERNWSILQLPNKN